MTDRISQEMNAKSECLHDDMKDYRTDTENILKEFRQNFSQFREELNSEQVTWQNRAGGEIYRANGSVRVVEEGVARLI